jgi:hypothetical protein
MGLADNLNLGVYQDEQAGGVPGFNQNQSGVVIGLTQQHKRGRCVSAQALVFNRLPMPRVAPVVKEELLEFGGLLLVVDVVAVLPEMALDP